MLTLTKSKALSENLQKISQEDANALREGILGPSVAISTRIKPDGSTKTIRARSRGAALDRINHFSQAVSLAAIGGDLHGFLVARGYAKRPVFSPRPSPTRSVIPAPAPISRGGVTIFRPTK